MNFHVITLFPNLVQGYLSDSILARAIREKKIMVYFYNPRDFATPSKAQKGKKQPYLRVDDKPYGGGPGMVMEAMPVIKAIEKAMKKAKGKAQVILTAPGGEQFTTIMAKKIIKAKKDVIIVAGRYEGIDERVAKIFKAKKISVGPYVLTGGEIPVMAIIDCVSRQVEGVLGNFDSREEERVASQEVYTRPEVLRHKGKNYKVPKVLLSGNHQKIEEWRGKRKN